MTTGWIDILGFLAAALTLATFAQQSMIPMRITALLANVCFICYGALGSYMPVLALHILLLPLNAIRLGPLLVRASAQRTDTPAADLEFGSAPMGGTTKSAM